jgi:intracellular septation protein A
MEGAIVPSVTFYVVLSCVSLRWALIASMLWSYLVITIRLAGRKKLPGLVVMSAGLLSARTAVAFAANSSFVYFLQPSLGYFCVAVLFLASFVSGKPLTRRLADDFCALPRALDAHPRFAGFFARLTLLWAAICVANGTGTLMLLLHESLGSYLALRPVFSYSLVTAGIVASYLWFRSAMRGEGIRIAFGRPVARAAPGD